MKIGEEEGDRVVSDSVLDADFDLDERYRLIRPLAAVSAGGYVYAAHHIRTRRACAVKLLSRGISELARKRTLREIDALARVQGPGIVDFRDAGESAGRLYLVLELLEGRTLAGLLAAKGKLDAPQAVKVACEIADALTLCHSRGVVHRDIKPANVFVTTHDSVQLLDFGIARDRGRHPADGEAHATEHAPRHPPIHGPGGAPPLAGRGPPRRSVRARCGPLRVPDGSRALRGTVRRGPPQGDGYRGTPSTLRPVAPAPLVAVMARALSRAPEERFANMAAMREALASVAPSKANATLFEAHAHAAQPQRNAPTVADAPQARRKEEGTRSRRRHARAPYVALARIRRRDRLHVDGRIEEVSESGFQFVGDCPLADGEAVTVRFALPASGRVTESAAVSRWNRS